MSPDSSGNTCFSNDEPLFMDMITGTGETTQFDRYYCIHDNLGSVVALTNDSGEVVESYKYTPWGDPTIYAADGSVLAESAIENPYLFTAREVDILDSGSLKIQHNRHRPHHYQLARWMTPDPLGVVPNDYYNPFNPLGQYADGVNVYQYVGDEPMGRLDNLGLAYFALRPLAGMPWIWGASHNPIDDYFNTEVSHEQVFISDGKKPNNLGFFAAEIDKKTKVVLKPEGVRSDDPLLVSGYRIIRYGYNDCVIRKSIVLIIPKPYSLLGAGSKDKYNCRDWAEEVRSIYSKLVVKASIKCLCKVKVSEIK